MNLKKLILVIGVIGLITVARASQSNSHVDWPLMALDCARQLAALVIFDYLCPLSNIIFIPLSMLLSCLSVYERLEYIIDRRETNPEDEQNQIMSSNIMLITPLTYIYFRTGLQLPSLERFGRLVTRFLIHGLLIPLCIALLFS